MGIFKRRKLREATLASSSRVRVDKKTKHLTQRLQAGEIAVIDHADIDRIAAETLVAAAPSAVLNAAKSTTGRYPNMGPSIIVDAGITLIDDLGSRIMNLKEGTKVTIEGNSVFQNGQLVAEGVQQTPGTIAADLEEARKGVSTQIEAFAANTMEYLRRERDLLLDGVGVPEVKTKFAGKHALIVVRGYHYQEDLRSLRP